MRRNLLVTLLVVSAAVPIIIGASCPPPASPYFTTIGTGTGQSATQVPNCSPGFVCISIVNNTCIEVEVALYVHNGFDVGLRYCEFQRGIQVIGTPLRASEECPGYNLGEFQVARPQLFDPPELEPSNLYQIAGQDVRVLLPRETVLERIQVGNIKTFGLSVGRRGTLPDEPALQDAPRYRCTETSLGVVRVPRLPEDVAAGQTFQFVITDDINCGLPGSALLSLRTGTSGSAGCPSVR